MHKNKTVEEFLANANQWQDELMYLRELMLKLEFEETVKWGVPVYMDSNGKNVIGIAGFKSYFGIWFYQGVFLSDEHGKLFNAQEGVTKALRQWRFSSLDEVKDNQDIIISYAREALTNSLNGKELKPESKKVDLPILLSVELQSNQALKTNFEALSIGKQKEYMEYINQAKREETKVTRMEKIRPMILAGVGLNDKYRKC